MEKSMVLRKKKDEVVGHSGEIQVGLKREL
jgi:hypothetical protein